MHATRPLAALLLGLTALTSSGCIIGPPRRTVVVYEERYRAPVVVHERSCPPPVVVYEERRAPVVFVESRRCPPPVVVARPAPRPVVVVTRPAPRPVVVTQPGRRKTQTVVVTR